MMIIQAYMLSDARISVNRQGGGMPSIPLRFGETIECHGGALWSSQNHQRRDI